MILSKRLDLLDLGDLSFILRFCCCTTFETLSKSSHTLHQSILCCGESDHAALCLDSLIYEMEMESSRISHALIKVQKCCELLAVNRSGVFFPCVLSITLSFFSTSVSSCKTLKLISENFLEHFFHAFFWDPGIQPCGTFDSPSLICLRPTSDNEGETRNFSCYAKKIIVQTNDSAREGLK